MELVRRPSLLPLLKKSWGCGQKVGPPPYSKLTADLTCDVSSLPIQEVVSEILEFIKKQGSSVTLDKPLLNVLIDSYSSDYVKNITDKKYGDGASDYIVKAFRYYSENNTPSKK